MTQRSPCSSTGRLYHTDIPARLDRLPWTRFHTLLVIALGITWLLDGLEVTLAGSVSGALKDSPALQMSNTDIGLAGAAYIAGAVLGALLFGWLTDRLGRRRLFFVTLALYIGATAATAFSWNLASFLLFRFLTGAGIGGEYTAINSTIQSSPRALSRLGGSGDQRHLLAGAALGAIGAVILLDPAWIGGDLGWRLCFGIGALLGLAILLMRLWIPESPRWLMVHGQPERAERIVSDIEHQLRGCGAVLPSLDAPLLRLRTRDHTPLGEVMHSLFVVHRRRALVGLTLLSAQAFFYNAIFFTYALVLTDFYGVPSERIGWYVLPFALGNFCGPLLLGRLFDVLGRRVMISTTYLVSGVLLAISGYGFEQGLLDVTEQTAAWMVIFFSPPPPPAPPISPCPRPFPGNPCLGHRRVLCLRHRAGRFDRTRVVRCIDRDWRAHQRVVRLPDRRKPDDHRRAGASTLGHRRRTPRAGACGQALSQEPDD